MYFSVHKAVTIQGRPYIPCICYEAGNSLMATIEKLKEDGIATIYSDKVHFANGVVINMPKPVKITKAKKHK